MHPDIRVEADVKPTVRPSDASRRYSKASVALVDCDAPRGRYRSDSRQTTESNWIASTGILEARQLLRYQEKIIELREMGYPSYLRVARPIGRSLNS